MIQIQRMPAGQEPKVMPTVGLIPPRHWTGKEGVPCNLLDSWSSTPQVMHQNIHSSGLLCSWFCPNTRQAFRDLLVHGQ